MPDHPPLPRPAVAPIEREPRRVRPPFDTRDDRFAHLMTTDPHGWRRAVHLDRVAALLEPLAGVEMSEREHAIIEWLAGWDIPTIAPVVRLLHAARAAAPLADETGDRRQSHGRDPVTPPPVR